MGTLLSVLTAAAQTDGTEVFKPRSIGFHLVGTRRDASQMAGSGMGSGGQLSLEFYLTRKVSFLASGGILTASDDFFETETQKIILLPSIDFAFKYNMVTGQVFQPFLTAGFGFYNSTIKQITASGSNTGNADLEGCVSMGTGFELVLDRRQTKFWISGEYRNSVFSKLDTKPIYWVAKAGVTLDLNRTALASTTATEQQNFASLFTNDDGAAAAARRTTDSLLEDRMKELEQNVTSNKQRIEEMKTIVYSHDARFAEMGGYPVQQGMQVAAQPRQLYNQPPQTFSQQPQQSYAQQPQQSYAQPQYGQQSQQTYMQQPQQTYVPPQQTYVQQPQSYPQQGQAAVPYMTRYKQALEVYKQADYQTAMAMFQALLNEEPYHKFADNCRYWIGECNYALGDCANAIIQFNNILAGQSSTKLDDSLLMKGQCYLMMGQQEEAFTAFRELLRRFPDSEYVGRARHYLNVGI